VLRGLVLSGLAWLMALPLLVSLEAGLLAVMLFEPFRGFIRRAQYLVVDYTTTDPIHILTPLVTLIAFAVLLRLRRFQLFHETPLAAPVSILGAIYLIQIFNPLQGGLIVGLSGALFILVPVTWFYFGQVMKPSFLVTALRLVVILGLVTSLYGVYQLAFGFPSFEQYWIDHTEFYESIAVGHVKRALATYNSAEEWGRYIEIGALAAFGLGVGANRVAPRTGWCLCGAALSVVLLLTGQRSSIFGLILGFAVLILLGARTWKAAAGRAALMLMPVLLVSVLAKPPSPDEMWRKSEDEKFGTMLSHTTRGTLQPTQEESLQARVETWTYLATEVIPYRPLGSGLGAGSLSALRFDQGPALPPIDSFVLVVVVACGIPAALLLLWILGRATMIAVRGARRATPGTPEATLWRIAGSLMAVLILNNLFGMTFSLYSVAPLGWLLLGWISAGESRAKFKN